MTDHRRPKRVTQTPTGKDLLPEFEAAIAGDDAARDDAADGEAADRGDQPAPVVASREPDETDDPDGTAGLTAGAPGPDDGSASDPDDVASPELSRLRAIDDSSAVRAHPGGTTSDPSTAPGIEDEPKDVEAEEPGSSGDGMTRWHHRRRRRRAARAARAKPKPKGRRRSTLDERDPTATAEAAAADEREALGRIDSGQDLFGTQTASPPETGATAATADEVAAEDDAAVSDGFPDGEEPVEDDAPDAEGAVEAPQHVGRVSAGADIGEFFAPQPPPSPTLLERLGPTGVALAVGFIVVALGAVAVGLGWVDRARELVITPDAEIAEDPPPGGWQPALLLATTVPSEGSSDHLRGLLVVASDRSTGEATVLLIPTATVTDVPGFGSFTLEEAWDLGGSSLVAVTVDNLLGLRIDGVLVKDEASWAAWFEPVGGASIDIPSRIVARDGPTAGSVRFEAGTEFLTPARIGEYLTVRAEGETELQSLPRAQQVLAALSRELTSEPDALDVVVNVSRTLPGTATPERVRAVVGELAEARAEDAATTITLPIVPLGTGPDEVYRPDEERLDALMSDRFANSRDVDDSGTRMAVQILNGNARPGIGQDVADALADGRYRIVLTGNADRFTYRETRILIYSDDPADLAAAQDISDRLGVGVIERSGTPQSVVDVTIIVGADFPPDG